MVRSWRSLHPRVVCSYHPKLRIFVTVGFCGGYTTFSSFSLQTLALMQEGEWLYAAANTGLSVILCLAAVWLGYVGVALFAR